MGQIVYEKNGKVRYIPDVLDASGMSVSDLQTRGQFLPDRQLPAFASRSANWSDINPTRLIETARKSVVVYACLSYLADAVAESPLRVYRTRGERKEVPDHRARQILANPNPFMSEAEFTALNVMAMGMQGYAVVEKVRSAGGLPVELWPLRPDWLTRRVDPFGKRTLDWDYRVPGEDARTISPEDLIVIPYRHDERQERPGVSPLQIAAREIGIDSSLTEFLKVFLDNGGIPPFALEYPEAIADQATIDAMQEMWQQRYGGSKAYGKLPILHGGYKIVKVGDGINDMAWPDLRSITEDKICQAFRVPRELVQTHSTANGGSGLTTTEQEGAMASLQRYGATPLRNRIDGALTRSFLFEFTGGDPQYELAFDISDVLALQEDQDALHTRIRADFQGMLLTMDEARIELGLQPLPNGQGQVFAVPFSVVFTRPADLIAPAPAPTPAIPATTPTTETPPKGQRRYRDVKRLGMADLQLRSNAVASNRRQQARLADVLGRKLRGLFSAQADRIAGSIAKSGTGIIWTPGKVELRSLVDIDWQEEENALSEVLTRFYHETGVAAAKQASTLLGVDVDWNLSNPNINQVQARLGTRIRAIAETTRQDVSRTVADGLTNGQTLTEIADNVRGLLGGDSYKNRSMTISRTESQVAYNSASLASYQESGVVDSVEFADNPDHATDPGSDGLTCSERNGLTVPLADAQQHIDAEHPNGSLCAIPVVELGA